MGADILGPGCGGHADTGNSLSTVLLVAHSSNRLSYLLQLSHADSLVQLFCGLALQSSESEIRWGSPFQESAICFYRVDNRGFSYGRLLGSGGVLHCCQLSGFARLV